MKKLVIFVAVPILLIVIAGLLAPYFMNSERFKRMVVDLALEKTGYHLLVDGDVSMRVIPSPAVKLQKVSLAVPDHQDEPFITMDSLDVGLFFLPLLDSEIEVSRLSLNTPIIQLVENKSGNNWQPAKADNKKTEKNGLENDTINERTLSGLRNIVLHDVNVSSGTISYQNTIDKTKLTLEKFELDASMAGINKPLNLNISTVFNDKPMSIKGTMDSLDSFAQSKETGLNLLIDSKPLHFSFSGNFIQLRLKGDVSVKTASAMDISAWATGKPAKSTVPPVAIAMRGQFDCTPNICKVHDMTADVNDFALNGEVGINLMETNVPHITANLATKTLDLSSFLKKEKAGLSVISSAHAEQTSGMWSKEPIDLSFLTSFKANISIAFQEIIAGKFHTGAGTFRAKNDRGNSSADIIDWNVHGGKANIFINTTPSRKIDGRVLASDIQLEPMLNELLDNNRFAGKATTQFAFSSMSHSIHNLVNNLNGSGNISIKDGSIKGIDLANMIRNIQSAYKNVDTSKQQTDFTEMGGSFVIKNGMIANNDLDIKAPLFRVGGKGVIDLPNYSINYSLTPEFVDTLKGQGGGERQGVGVPVLIAGPLDNPKFAPDVKGMVEDAIKNPEKVKENIDAIKGLFKKQKSEPAPAAAPPVGTTDSNTQAAPDAQPQPEKPMNQLKNILKAF